MVDLLLLLLHLARRIRSDRVLFLGTYRDVELERTHPLAETVAALRTDGLYERVLLRGLTHEGVRDLLRAGAGLLLGLSLACLLLGRWQVGGLMLLGMLLLFFAYSRLRLKHRAAACQTCPELNQGRICSGYRRQAVYIRRYQDEMAVYLEAEIGRDRGWHVPGKD